MQCEETTILQLKGCFLISVLGLTSSLVMADEVNCTTLANPQARKECAEYKVNNNSGNSVDCSKLATPEARRQCAKQKAK